MLNKDLFRHTKDDNWKIRPKRKLRDLASAKKKSGQLELWNLFKEKEKKNKGVVAHACETFYETKEKIKT